MDLVPMQDTEVFALEGQLGLTYPTLISPDLMA